MKRIAYEDWQKRFEIHSGRVELADVESYEGALVFYDSGAVADEEGNFIVKADNVQPRKTGG